MAKKVVGIQKNVKFKVDGKDWSGLNLYFEEEKNGVDGVATEKAFINDTKDCYSSALALKVGDEVKCSYNRYGKIEDISVVTKQTLT